MICDRISQVFPFLPLRGTANYRDALKGGPVLLSNSQAGPGRARLKFYATCRAYLLVNPCTKFYVYDQCPVSPSNILVFHLVITEFEMRKNVFPGYMIPPLGRVHAT